jgi:hypothetical protein
MQLTRWSRVSATGLLTILSLAYVAPGNAQSSQSTYQLLFELELTAGQSTANAAITLSQRTSALIELRFRAPLHQFTEFRGDGKIQRAGDIVTWRPPDSGGILHYNVEINHNRNAGGFDALITDDWALFRADDVFPPARIRRKVGTTGTSSLILSVPKGWSAVTPFMKGPDNQSVVDNPKRMFDRPVGWIIAGHLGVRRDFISGIDVSVAAPKDAGTERVSMLALLSWTLPYLTRELDEVPDRLSVVSANDPMWRGGLSAPNSIFVHADRPLLSENATSTLLHETVHMLTGFPTDPDQDWIDEGIAEYLTLETLRRSGTISDKRFTAAIEGFRKRGKSVESLSARISKGDITARAVVIFAALDLEIQKTTDGDADIFTLLRLLMMEKTPVDVPRLRDLALEITAAEDAVNNSIKSLAPDQLPGFEE